MTEPEWSAGLPRPLALLAEELLVLGLGVEVRFSAEGAFLKVWHPGLVVTGLSICQELETLEELQWFRVCGGGLLAPCDDVPEAAVCIHEVLETMAADLRVPLEEVAGVRGLSPR